MYTMRVLSYLVGLVKSVHGFNNMGGRSNNSLLIWLLLHLYLNVFAFESASFPAVYSLFLLI